MFPPARAVVRVDVRRPWDDRLPLALPADPADLLVRLVLHGDAARLHGDAERAFVEWVAPARALEVEGPDPVPVLASLQKCSQLLGLPLPEPLDAWGMTRAEREDFARRHPRQAAGDRT